jgi:Cu2+-exporting ATPase
MPRGEERRAAVDLPSPAIYDDPVAQRHFVARRGPHEREVLLILDRITCAACIWLNERTLRALPGVLRADLNATTHRAVVAWDERRIALGAILQAIRAIGYDAYPFDPARHCALEAAERRAALWRLFVSRFAAMQVMMYAIPAYLDGGGTLSAEAAALMRWASLVLTLPVIVFACGPFFGPAWRDLRAGRIGLDAPIALGIVVGFGASAWATFTGAGEVYFDSIAMLVFLLLAARGAEAAARRRAGRALDPLLRWMPAFALRMREGAASETIAAHELAAGDLALVPPGERMPADGVVVEGASSADESLLTGESLPVPKLPGAAVVAGSVNLEQPLVVRVERAGSDTRAAAILRMVERASASRPPLVAGADRIASAFAWIVLAAALAAFAHERSVWTAVAVLVVTCPCALALAAPIALTACTTQLLARGVVLTRARALQALARATDVVLDKTGTLTEGRLRIARTRVLGNAPVEECLALARALEASSRHPIAAAFEAAARDLPAATVSEVVHFPGAGIEANSAGCRIRVGTVAFCEPLAGSPLAGSIGAHTSVALAADGSWLALFSLEDRVRPEAREFVDRLRAAGLRVHLLSGDRAQVANELARTLAIEDCVGAADPQQKLAHVERLQQQGRVVVMIGDGWNDAPVLARADASIAMGSGASIAQLNSDLVLLGGRLAAALEVFPLARRTMRIIRQNFGWAIAYNVVALPAAMLGWIGPWEAALGMAGSSLAVALNSLRLVAIGRAGPSWKASISSFPSPSRSYS